MRDGGRVLSAQEVRTSESEAGLEGRAGSFQAGAVVYRPPILAVIDGNEGLKNAVKSTWPWIDVQRCTKHKLENLQTHAPKRHYDEIKKNYPADRGCGHRGARATGLRSL